MNMIMSQHFHIEKLGNRPVTITRDLDIFGSALWRVPLMIAVAPWHVFKGEGVVEVSGSPGKHDDVVDVEPERHDSRSDSDAWKIPSS